MKRFLKYAVRSLIGIFLIVSLLCVVSADFRKVILGGVDDWMMISREQTSHPVTKEKAAKFFRSGYLPASAHDIQYAAAGCITPAFETFFRFEAPVQDLLDHAKLKYPDLVLEPITSVFQPKASMGVNADWFDTGKIKHGLIGSKEGSGATIWIDTDRGVFYFFDTD